ncbi:MAG: zinc ribbon domain-containing protein [Bellilinea sp.]
MSQSFHLFQLQKIDTQLDQGAARVNEISAKIETDRRVQDQQQVVDNASKVLASAQAQLKKIEQDADTRRIKLEQCEASLYGGKVKIPKELQDLQNEAAAIKRSISTLEDQQLEAMISVEDAQAQLNVAQKHLAILQAEVTHENAVLAGESSALKALMDRLKVEHQAVLGQIDQNFYDEYERLRKNKRGIAVASLTDNACSACGTVLTPADRQAARSPTILFHCPSCGRFIYAG